MSPSFLRRATVEESLLFGDISSSSGSISGRFGGVPVAVETVFYVTQASFKCAI